MLPAENYQLVPPPEIDVCLACGARSRGRSETDAGLQFVSFKMGGDVNDNVIATGGGKPQTYDFAAGATVVQHRDTTGKVVRTAVKNPMICSDCISIAGRLVGIENGLPLRAELEEKDRELGELRAELAAELERGSELEAAVRQSKTFDVMLDLAQRANERASKRSAATLPKPTVKPRRAAGKKAAA